MAKIFLTGKGSQRRYITGSGFISNPPRYLLRQFDSATGSYPTTLRNGDEARKGNYNIFFDDNDTIPFLSPFAEVIIDFSITNTEIDGVIYGTRTNSQIEPFDPKKITLTDVLGKSVKFEFRPRIQGGAYVTSNTIVYFPEVKRNRIEQATSFMNAVNDSILAIRAELILDQSLVNRFSSEQPQNRPIAKVKLVQELPGTAGNAITTTTTRTKNSGFFTPLKFTGGTDFNVNFPTGLPNFFEKLQKQQYATPNTLPALESSTSPIRKGVGDAHVRFTAGEGFTPFNDNIAEFEDTKFYLQGTPTSIVPGFSSPLKSKTIITVDFDNTRDQHIFRQTGKRNPEGQYPGKDFTGFCYLNWDEERWEQIGLTDPATGNDLFYDYALDPTLTPPGSTWNALSGSSNFVSQFGSPEGLGPVAVSQYDNTSAGLPNHVLSGNVNLELERCGYAHMGLPQFINGAPVANKYHATASQCLNMSDYITMPFVLEKLTLEIPVSARLHLSRPNPVASVAALFPAIYMQDISNYSFFVYNQFTRQDPNVLVDSPQYVTASDRILIASTSVCFYNRIAIKDNGIVTKDTYEWAPLHNPSFAHDWGNKDVNVDTPIYNEFTSSIKIEMTPAVTPALYAGISQIPATEAVPNAVGTAIQNAWPGGSKIEPYFIQTKSDRRMITGKPTLNYFTIHSTAFTYFLEFTESGPQVIGSLPIKTLENPRHNLVNQLGGEAINNPIGVYLGAGGSSFQRGAGGNSPLGYLSEDQFGAPPNQTTRIKSYAKAAISPYILFPHDKLVLGVEKNAGCQALALQQIGQNIRRGASGSLLTMNIGRCRLTLYGSEIRDKVEFHDTLNQHLTSDALHEIIAEPIHDQFIIEDDQSYIGSQLDQWIPGDVSPVVDGVALGDFGDYLPLAQSGKPANPAAPISRIGYRVLSVISGSTATINTPMIAYRTGSASSYSFKRMIACTSQNQSFQDTRTYIAVEEPFRLVGITDRLYPAFTASLVQIDQLGGSSNIPYSALNSKNLKNTYMFRPDCYGQYADLIQQGHDGRFFGITDETNLNPHRAQPDNTITPGICPGAVYVRFVTEITASTRSQLIERGSNSLAGVGVAGRRFAKTQVGSRELLNPGSMGRSRSVLGQEQNNSANFIKVTTYNMQSSNLSTFATSSLPFIDDGIPRNRLYRKITT